MRSETTGSKKLAAVHWWMSVCYYTVDAESEIEAVNVSWLTRKWVSVVA